MGSTNCWCVALLSAALLSGETSAQTSLNWNDPKFQTFRQVYVNCPARVFALEPNQLAETAHWFADPANKVRVDKMLSTCTKEEKHLAKRSWPPTEESAKVVLPPRYFRWDPVLQQQVEVKPPR